MLLLRLFACAGASVIRRQLLRGDPSTVLRSLHSVRSVRSVASLPAVYSLLSALDVGRVDSNRRVGAALLARLLHRLASATAQSSTQLLRLLDDSIAYIALDELRVVPLAIMQRLSGPLPKRILRRLTEQRTALQVG